jgi:hypothetical protein
MYQGGYNAILFVIGGEKIIFWYRWGGIVVFGIGGNFIFSFKIKLLSGIFPTIFEIFEYDKKTIFKTVAIFYFLNIWIYIFRRLRKLSTILENFTF